MPCLPGCQPPLSFTSSGLACLADLPECQTAEHRHRGQLAIKQTLMRILKISSRGYYLFTKKKKKEKTPVRARMSSKRNWSLRCNVLNSPTSISC